MSNIEDAVENLTQAILYSREYQDYRIQLKRVKEVPELKEKIDEYRTKNYILQSSKDYAFDKIEAFEREYADFVENPLVMDFLDAELSLCRMIQGVSDKVVMALHFE